MDIMSFAGIVIALGALLGGNYLEGGTIGALLNGPAFMIVFGGTMGAVFLQTPLTVFLHAMKLTAWVFMPPKLNMGEGIGKIIEWSSVARKEGLFALQEHSEGETDEFVRRAMELLIDGGRPEDVQLIMEVEMDTSEHHDTEAAKFYDGLGGYAPTVGIIGAVMGLITVMQNLANPDALGGGIAVAFVATIYAVSLANLYFLPMANKIKSVIARQGKYREMMLQGLLAIAEGVHPHFIKARLMSYAGHDAHVEEEKDEGEGGE